MNLRIKYKDFLFLWYILSCKNRHLWRHHYFGTQGIVLIFGLRSKILTENDIFETLNVFKDTNLHGIPFLLLFDKSNNQIDNYKIIDKLKMKLNEENFFYYIQFINFSNSNDLKEVSNGLDWLSQQMKPLIQ